MSGEINVLSRTQVINVDPPSGSISVINAGPAGPGMVWSSGSGAPTGGNDGDYYVRLSNYDLYKKTSGTWSVIGNIKGATGDTGATGSTGDTGPSFIPTFSSPALVPTGGMIESFPRQLGAPANLTAELTSGKPSLYALPIETGKTITSITFRSGTTAGGSMTNQWFGLFDNNRNRLRLTTDDGSTAWYSNSFKTLNLSSTFNTSYSGLYYVGIMVAATTVPTLFGLASNNTLVGYSPILRGASSTTGLTNPASCPSQVGSLTAGSNAPYFYVS